MVLLKSTAKSLIEGKETSDYLKEEERYNSTHTHTQCIYMHGVL